MPNTPNTSFIPKQGPAKKIRQSVSRQVHVFTIISYLLFLSTLTAGAGVYFYGRHLDTQLATEANALNNAISGFSTSDMDRVESFHTRLRYAKDRIDHSVSITTIFKALEAATTKASSLNDFNLKRENDEQFTVSAKITADSFDTSLFQRSVFERNSVIRSVTTDDLTIENIGENSTQKAVSFTANITVPLESVGYQPSVTANAAAAPVLTGAPVTMPSIQVSTSSNNQ
jgi:SHS2 domain-containing protein